MNIYDIAEKCGVSIATVSRVLNNNPNVSAATRAKIQAVIDQENYTPNALARSLGNGGDANAAANTPAVPTVGVLCSAIRDPYYGDILAGLEEQLRKRGMNLLLHSGGETLEAEQQALAQMVASGVTAVICVGPNHYADMDYSPIAETAGQVPVILVEGYVDAINVFCITADRRGAVTDLVELLMRRGRRRILFLYDRMTLGCQQQLEGYQNAFAAAGLSADPQLMVQVEAQPDAVNQCIKRLLVNRVTFDAVIGAEDILALGAQKALLRTGLSMPIVGFHNSLTARCATPELSSIDCNPTALCAATMRVLDELAADRDPEPLTIVPTKLVERDSFRNT